MYLLANQFALLADEDAINRWLDENPMVLGSGALLLGLVLAGFGTRALLSGRSQDKWGNQMTGPMAHLHGAILAGFGALVIIFGLYKIVMGAL